MNTCGTCKHLSEEIERFDGETMKDVKTGYHVCKRVEHEKHENYKKGKGFLVVDGSGYYAALLVESDFGCLKWEEK